MKKAQGIRYSDIQEISSDSPYFSFGSKEFIK